MSDEALRQRLAAILAADAVGYSRLMAADERATVSALDAARAVFRREYEKEESTGDPGRNRPDTLSRLGPATVERDRAS